VEDDAVVEFIPSASSDGLRIYRRSLDFLLVIACEKVLGRKAILRHSIGEGHYWEFEDGDVTQSDVYKLHSTMSEMVRQDIPISRKILPIDKAKRILIKHKDFMNTIERCPQQVNNLLIVRNIIGMNQKKG